MTWREVLADKSLGNLPYKIELNNDGCIVMSPASNRHARYQGRITGKLYRIAKSGEVMTECAIETLDNVKVADVAWASVEFLKKHKDKTPFDMAPDLCVEVVSPSNTHASIERKRFLYFSKGAKEVWVCDGQARMSFFDVSGALTKSKLFPNFRSEID